MKIVSRSAAFLKDQTSPKTFQLIKGIYQAVFRPGKKTGELDFWKMKSVREGGLHGAHDYFHKIMPQMAKPLTPDDFTGKIIGDFGCGPRGTLTWLTDRAQCIGIDLLIPDYMSEFPDLMKSNKMTYVACSETHVPVQTGFLDVLFTMNALDHVVDLGVVCDELKRIIKPGGYLIASFNLDEEPTVTEPQMLNEAILEEHLLHAFDPVSERFAARFEDDHYAGFMGRDTPIEYEGPRLLWYVGKRKE